MLICGSKATGTAAENNQRCVLPKLIYCGLIAFFLRRSTLLPGISAGNKSTNGIQCSSHPTRSTGINRVSFPPYLFCHSSFLFLTVYLPTANLSTRKPLHLSEQPYLIQNLSSAKKISVLPSEGIRETCSAYNT